MKKETMSRRAFLASSAMAGFFIPASRVFGQAVKGPASKQFRFLKVAVGGMGAADLGALRKCGGICVGLCDVNGRLVNSKEKEFPGIPKFTDYRKMFDKIDVKDYDGVCVSTADHTHALIALAAMRRGKHVYVQKPLAHTYEECELLLAAAKKYGVVTQMGNQGHPGVYRYDKLMENGFWGDILEVHSWTDRAGKGWWPQGMTSAPKGGKPPADYDWDCWLGTAAPRPYDRAYVPFKWRGWCDFGCGAIGDMAVHNFDPAFHVLKLGLPQTIRAWTDQPAKIAYPVYSTIDFRFGPTPVCPKGLSAYWYESGLLPKPPLGADHRLNVGSNGCMIIGTKAATLGGSHASKPQAVAAGPTGTREERGEAARACNKLLAGNGKWAYNHYAEWIQACKANDPKATGSRFEYAVRLTETLLFGCIAQRFPGKTLVWDNDKQRFNLDAANAFLKSPRREGFDLSV